MLEKVEQVLSQNSLKYEAGGNTIYLSLGRASSKVKIRYDYATNTYLCSCSELALSTSSIIMFALAFNFMTQVGEQSWAGYVAGLMFAAGISNLFLLLITHVQLLDLKTQLREVGVYLKSGS